MINEDELLNPLTDAQIEELKDTQKRLRVIKQAIARARRAGINVTAQEAQVAELEQQSKGLLAEYGRTSPSSGQRST